MLLIQPSELELLLVWKVFMLMVSPSLMVLKAHISTSGHLLQHCSRRVNYVALNTGVLALISIGLLKCQSLWVTTISVTLATLDQSLTITLCTQTTLYGMVRGVVPPAPAVNLTPLHSSAPHCHNPTDDIEVRICLDRFDDIIVSLVDIYVM